MKNLLKHMLVFVLLFFVIPCFLLAQGWVSGVSTSYVPSQLVVMNDTQYAVFAYGFECNAFDNNGNKVLDSIKFHQYVANFENHAKFYKISTGWMAAGTSVFDYHATALGYSLGIFSKFTDWNAQHDWIRGTGNIGNDKAFNDAVLLPDESLLAVGWQLNPNTGKILIARCDTSGNLLFEKNIADSVYTTLTATRVERSPNGELFILAIRSNPFINEQVGVIKINESGDLLDSLWLEGNDYNFYNHYTINFKVGSDFMVICLNKTDFHKSEIIKIDNGLNVVYKKEYSNSFIPNKPVIHADGTFTVGGSLVVDQLGWTNDTTIFALKKFDGFGEEIWTTAHPYLGNFSEMTDFSGLADGGYLAIGSVSSPNNINKVIMKFDAEGKLSSNVSSINDGLNDDNNANELSIHIFPQPSNHEINVEITSKSSIIGKLSLHDFSGKTVATLFKNKQLSNEIVSAKYNLAGFPKGQYILQLETDNGKKYARKIIKL